MEPGVPQQCAFSKETLGCWFIPHLHPKWNTLRIGVNMSLSQVSCLCVSHITPAEAPSTTSQSLSACHVSKNSMPPTVNWHMPSFTSPAESQLMCLMEWLYPVSQAQCW